MTVDHPLAMLTPDEVRTAHRVLEEAGELVKGALIAHIVLDEPPKEQLASWAAGDPVPRFVRALVVPGPELTMVEVLADLVAGEVVSRTVVEGMRPALSMHESMLAVWACMEHPDYVAAIKLRGIDDLDLVQIDPWPAGTFGYAAEEGRRIARCISYLRETKTDNGYGHPIEGVIVHVDLGRGEVIEVIDHGLTPVPAAHARYDVASVGTMRTDLRAIEITQRDGPSFEVVGNLVVWQKWSLRLGFDPYEGLVLHQVGYRDGTGGTERVRSILHRASISEMVVPYGHPGETHGWKNAFDAGEWGLGRMTQPLTLGCDCLGEITYLDVTLANEQGDPWVIENAICLHEEDFGIAWKHVDLWSGTQEVRRQRRLVVSHIATVGNYEYGFYWYFYLDGTIQFEVKLTGIMSPMAFDPADDPPECAVVIGPGIAAPVHQHLFCARLDFDVDGTTNRVEEVQVEPLPAGPANPWANGFGPTSTVLGREADAKRMVDPATSRAWKVINPGVRNGLGGAVGYKLNPHMSTPAMLAAPESSIGRRAGFARHNMWVTPYCREERRAAGEYPNQHAGGGGLPEWTAADRALVDTDVVLWYSFGVTHVPRPEDWPVMPVEYTGFLLQPVGFFDRNPALDVPPTHVEHCGDGDGQTER